MSRKRSDTPIRLPRIQTIRAWDWDAPSCHEACSCSGSAACSPHALARAETTSRCKRPARPLDLKWNIKRSGSQSKQADFRDSDRTNDIRLPEALLKSEGSLLTLNLE